MSWDLITDPKVRKQLKRIPRKEALRLAAVIRDLVINPYAGDIEKMEGEKDAWRRRIGSYRIFYEINMSRKIIHVFNVERRTSKTY